MTQSDPRQKIFSVLAALPQYNGASTEAELWACATRIVTPAFFAALEDAPRFKEEHSSKVGAEIKKYAKLCRDLGLHIKAMSATALKEVETNKTAHAPHPLHLLDDLVLAVQSAQAAFEKLPEKGLRAPAGAKGKPLAREVTVAATEAFETITGRPATRVTRDGKSGGEYVEFLSNIFSVLRIKASAESQARLMEEMRR